MADTGFWAWAKAQAKKTEKTRKEELEELADLGEHPPLGSLGLDRPRNNR